MSKQAHQRDEVRLPLDKLYNEPDKYSSYQKGRVVMIENRLPSR